MKSKMKKFALGAVASLLLVIFVAGCSSEPAATPITDRKPGQDITPDARADKRGDVPEVKGGK